MEKFDELNNTPFISQDKIPKDDKDDKDDKGIKPCIGGDISIIASELDNIIENIIIYTDDEIKQAEQFGVSVEELFKIYEEINNYEPDEPSCNCEEWPIWNGQGYEDEGLEESMY